MEKILSKKVIQLSKETAFILLAVIGAVVLPQIFHVLGIWFGVGGKLGQIFLPMYIPILIIGFYRGPVSGAIAGLCAPLISFALTKMPSSALLPFITVELIATGVLAGVFAIAVMSRKKISGAVLFGILGSAVLYYFICFFYFVHA